MAPNEVRLYSKGSTLGLCAMSVSLLGWGNGIPRVPKVTGLAGNPNYTQSQLEAIRRNEARKQKKGGGR